MFEWNILNKKHDKILKAVFESVMRSLLDSWARQVEALKEAWGGGSSVSGPQEVAEE